MWRSQLCLPGCDAHSRFFLNVTLTTVSSCMWRSQLCLPVCDAHRPVFLGVTVIAVCVCLPVCDAHSCIFLDVTRIFRETISDCTVSLSRRQYSSVYMLLVIVILMRHSQTTTSLHIPPGGYIEGMITQTVMVRGLFARKAGVLFPTDQLRKVSTCPGTGR
jgi:hypothetical protein